MDSEQRAYHLNVSRYAPKIKPTKVKRKKPITINTLKRIGSVDFSSNLLGPRCGRWERLLAVLWGSTVPKIFPGKGASDADQRRK